MKDAYYFSHDAGARYDQKIVAMRSIHGWTGYGWYWCIIEMMRESKNFKIPLSQYDKLALMKELEIDEKTLSRFIEDCINIGLFCVQSIKNSDFLISQSFLARMKAMNERRSKYIEAGRLGGIKKASIARASLEHRCSNALPLKESKVKEIKVKEIKEKDTCVHFDSLWQKYPKKLGHKEALRHYNATVKSEPDAVDIERALDNYLKYINIKRIEHQFIQHGSTWFNNWRDWVNYEIELTGEEHARLIEEQLSL